jgi:hypothetical protein
MGKYGRKPFSGAAAVSEVLTSYELSMHNKEADQTRPA